MSQTEPVAPPRCYVHTDRLAGSVCRRCGRPICPDCMHEAPVGWQCTSCVRQGARVSPSVRWRPKTQGRLGNTRLTPMVIGLIVLNFAIYLWELTKFNNIVERFAMWPNGVHYLNQYYRLITAAFLHASFWHIAFNMVTLAIIGSPVEAEVGKVRFGAIYLLSALGGSVASYVLSNPNQLGVGASGAIFGLMGGYLVLARRNRWDRSTIIALIVVNLAYSFAESTIDWRAHIGGLVVGAVVSLGLVVGAEDRDPARSTILQTGVVAATVAVLGLLLLLPPGHVNL
jgi:membrane associated rhomboid family serine protease